MPHAAATPACLSSPVAAHSALVLSSMRSSDTTTPCRNQQPLHFVAVSPAMQSLRGSREWDSLPSLSATETLTTPWGTPLLLQMIISLRPSVILPTGSLFQYLSTRSFSAHVLGRISGRCRRREGAAHPLLLRTRSSMDPSKSPSPLRRALQHVLCIR